jgi:hypothetical protein
MTPLVRRIALQVTGEAPDRYRGQYKSRLVSLNNKISVINEPQTNITEDVSETLATSHATSFTRALPTRPTM